MATVIEQEFFLSEILGRRVFVKKKRIGRLSDLAIVETGKLPEVTHVVVSRSFGYAPLTVPWDRVRLISNQEDRARHRRGYRWRNSSARRRRI